MPFGFFQVSPQYLSFLILDPVYDHMLHLIVFLVFFFQSSLVWNTFSIFPCLLVWNSLSIFPRDSFTHCSTFCSVTCPSTCPVPAYIETERVPCQQEYHRCAILSALLGDMQYCATFGDV